MVGPGPRIDDRRPARVEAAPRAETAAVERRRPDRSRTVAVVLVVLFAVFFVVRSWPQITAPFGDSHDGRNGAVWALASRTLREQGVVGSRAGSRLEHIGTYAHHPPLIVAEAAAAESVAGEQPWATRMAAWLGSVVTLGLVFVLLRRRGMSALASAVGVVVAFGTPMFFVYGTMLDTLQTSLPFAVGFLIVWSGRDDDPGSPAWPVVVLAAMTVLASWEGALLVAAATAVDRVVAGRRRRRLGVPPAGWGLLAGAALLVTWLLWAQGSLGPIFDQFQVRSGGTGSAPSLGEFVSSQRVFFDRTYSPLLGLIGVAGLVFAIRSARLRRLAVTVTVVVVAYPLALHDAAFHHDYWNYWFLLAFAIGATALVQAGLDLAARHGDGHLVGAASVGCVLLAVVLGAMGATRDTVSVEQQVTGRQAGVIARDGGSHLTYLVGNELPPADWFTYYTGHSYHRLDTPRSIQLAAQRAPDADVLLRCGDETPWLLRACTQFGLRIGQYRAVPLRRLERVLT